MAKRIKDGNDQLTKAELEVMQILWRKGDAFVNEIIAEMEEPKPAYNTVSTVIRILEKKGFVGYNVFGKSHRYYTLMGEEEYKGRFMNSVMNTFFDNSVANMMSFFCEKENLSVEETEEIIRIAEEAIAKRNDN